MSSVSSMRCMPDFLLFISYAVFTAQCTYSAKRGIAIVSRPSVCLSVRPSETLTYRDQLGI